MKRISITAAVIAGSAVLAAPSAFAGNTVGGDIHVGLTVVDECTIATNNLTFPVTGIVNSPVDTTADMTIECTKHTPYAISLDGGGTNNVAGRQLVNGSYPSDPVNYQLYWDSGHLHPWGETVGTDTVDSADATGGDETHTIYARIPSHQNVPVGTYTDTIIATIWYADDATPGP